MIPKKIHYCWFGGNPLNKMAKKCMESWRTFCPDYEIIEWNESSFDVNSIVYTKQAYEAKKFAFVSDYARFDIIHQHGGVYLDVDVELLKPLDSLLQNNAYMGFELKNCVNAGLGFGAVAGHELIRDFIKIYEDRSFLKENRKPDFTTVVQIVTDELVRLGLNPNNELQVLKDCTIYPTDFFQPINKKTERLEISENTYSIHHYASSWYSGGHKFAKKMSRLLGPGVTGVVRKILRRNKAMKDEKNNNS